MDKESVLLDSEDRMDKALGALDRDFSRLRTGRASTGLVDNIKVDYYGTPTPISQLASVAIPDSRTITIQPWDRGAFASVEKAILKSDLGLTPVNDGKIIRISIPPLTEDRRKELGKLARKSGEEAKVAVRNVRRDANDQIKKMKKDNLITEDEQKKRIEKLENSSVTSWRVESHDIKNMEKYDKFFRRYDKMLESTNTAFAPWTCVGANERASAELEVLTAVTKAVSTAVSTKEKGEHYIPEPQFDTCGYNYPEYKTIEMPALAEVDMNKSLDEAKYEKKLKKYQDKLFKLQNLCYQKKIPVIMCYEGWDAAGKGGNIKRIAAALDPRGYEVHPIAAPEPSELARHYLWRFWTRLEKNGHFTIFDRTWYGRVMVEPIEKLTPEERVNMAYREINEFESQLHDWGAEIIKFWVNVDKDEQLRRFNERENTPEKRWKITDEDWRNREKWDTYEKYVDRMITLTSTDIAPWTILEGNDKKYARIKALKTIVKRLEKRLEKEDK